MSPANLGTFSLFLAGYTALTLASAALTAEPLMVRYSGVPRIRWRSGVKAATGCTLILGLACAVILGVAGLALQGTARPLMFIGAACAPGLLIQDTLRYAFFANGEPKMAFIIDATWGCAQLLGVIAGTVWAHASIEVLVLAWAGAGACSGGLALIQARIVPSPTKARVWLREQRDLWAFILPELLTVQGANYISLIGIGAVAGVSAVAAVRGAQALYGPLNVALNGARVIVLPHLVGLDRGGVRRLVRILVFATTCGVGVWGILTTLAPARVGIAVLGQTWPLAVPLLGFMVVDRIGVFAMESWRTGLLALASVRRNFSVRLSMAAVGVPATVVGAAVGGARGAVIAAAIVSPLSAVLFRRQFLFASRSPDAERAVGAAD